MNKVYLVQCPIGDWELESNHIIGTAISLEEAEKMKNSFIENIKEQINNIPPCPVNLPERYSSKDLLELENMSPEEYDKYIKWYYREGASALSQYKIENIFINIIEINKINYVKTRR